MSKEAQTTLPVLSIIKKRWSPRAFSDKAISNNDLEVIFEAGRWAMSSYNEQPWRFFVAQKQDPHYSLLFSCLNEWNQKWAKTAAAIVLICGKKTYDFDGSENKSYAYDCGAAAAFMTLQATELGLFCHQMGGILPEKARQELQIPNHFEALTAMAIGYLGDIQNIDQEFHSDEQEKRTRKPIEKLVYSSCWEEPYRSTNQ